MQRPGKLGISPSTLHLRNNKTGFGRFFLSNFRSSQQAEIELQRDLTVFVGENNGGKSNAIDATQAAFGMRFNRDRT
ncbi:AAA family ATPase [Rhizobium sp. 2YAF20]|uniref:AAA family ATPase n=1 Tax=Rhizobium sp. 2YAF20 TaxID=3233027 RepID=UPI003F9AEA3C